MLGLDKGKVMLTEYDPKWKEIFKDEKELLKKIFEEVGLKSRIRHVGSTSIPLIKSKPIIDIAIGFENEKDQHAGFQALRKNGIEYVPVANQPGAIFMVKGDPRLFHYHLVINGTYGWNKLILVKKYLLSHPMIAKEYEFLKVELAEKNPDSRQSYTLGKVDFIDAIIKRAIAYENRKKHNIAFKRTEKYLSRENLNQGEYKV